MARTTSSSRVAGFVRHGAPRLARESVTMVHAAAVLALVEALIRWVDLPKLSRWLGCSIDLTPPPAGPGVLLPSDLERRARRQLRCARRVADAWPLSRGPCLRRALVGGHLVRRLDPSIRLGTHVGSGDIVAHAWLEIGGRTIEDVSGYSMFEQVPAAGRARSGAEQS